MINSTSKFKLVKNSLKISSPKQKKEYILQELEKLSKHQSDWFLRKFSSEIPHSLQIVICDLTDAQNLEKGSREQKTYNDILISVCEEFLKINKDNNESNETIQNILNKAKKKDLISKNKGITNSNYIQYKRIKRFGKYGIDGNSNGVKFIDEGNNQCTITYSNRDIYMGGYKKNTNSYIIPQGKGKLTCKEGYTYDGWFKEGWAEGNGIVEYQSRSVFGNVTKKTYSGEFKEGWVEGNGKMRCSWGITYEGEFNNGMLLEGKGKITNHGVNCEGEFKGGILHEESNYTITYPTGEIYTSTWDANTSLRRNSIRYLNGDIYEGNFEDNNLFSFPPRPDGYGTLKSLNGNIYKGKFTNGKAHNGTLTYWNSSVYKGTFKDGKRYNGTLTYLNGSVYKGTFKDGKPYNGTLDYQNNSKKVQGKITNGKDPNGRIFLGGQLITEEEIQSKVLGFIKWFEKNLPQKDKEYEEFEYIINDEAKLKLKISPDMVSFDPPNEFKEIIIVKMDRIFLIQDAVAYLNWFENRNVLPQTQCLAIKGVNYWLEDNLINFIMLTNWRPEACKLLGNQKLE